MVDSPGFRKENNCRCKKSSNSSRIKQRSRYIPGLCLAATLFFLSKDRPSSSKSMANNGDRD